MRRKMILTGAAVSVALDLVAIPLFDTPREPSFDPAAAGWTRVFHDDFDGDAVDTNKWYRPHFCRKGMDIGTDGKGHAVFRMRKGEDGRLPNGYLYSVPEYEYGYYEARVRFTSALGWGAASWMYGGSNQNPFLDGFEIDTFEDFYTRLKDGHCLRDKMAHSMHSKIGPVTSSQQCVSTVRKTADDFHLIACKWDPLAISFYLDGELVGGYNAFENATCIRPLHAILSAERSRGGLGVHEKPGCEEGDYVIDRVSVWKDLKGEALAPKVTWKTDMGSVFAPTGTVEHLAVDAVSPDPADPVEQVYLFDNGHFILADTEPPYAFEMPLTEAFLRTTSYGRFRTHAGREMPPLDGYPHVFVAFARTKSGRVGHTGPFVRILLPQPGPAAYEDRPAAVPGTVEAWKFDVGGQDKAYHKVVLNKKTGSRSPSASASPRPDDPVDLSKSRLGPTFAGEWYDYTVDVAATGDYRATLRYASAVRSANAVWLLCDGRLVGEFAIPAGDYYDSNPTRTTTADVKLPAGRHVLTVFCKSQISFAGIDFGNVP